MTLLPATLTLADVPDAEALCRRVLDRELAHWTAKLQPADRDEALAHLVTECWLLHESFDPERNDSFEGYAKKYLPLRVVDYFRDRFGRNGHHHPGVGAVSFDELSESERDAVVARSLELPAEAADEDHDTLRIIDESKLSVPSRAILRRELDGYKQVETARALGATQKRVSAQMARLREEIVCQIKAA